MKSTRILPLLLIVATLAFTLRVSEVVSGFRNLSGAAIAEDTKAADGAKNDDKKADDKEHTAKKSDDKMMADKDAKGEGKDAKGDAEAKPEDWPDPGDMDPDLAEVRTNLLKDLAARRKQLDDREKMLSTREAVMKAAEAEIDQKYRELTELRKQLQGLLDDQSQAEAERLKSLVKIYEGMKPADAARIFNTLDLSILMDVLTRMSERKSAPILAAMEADRARTVTLMMAQQKKLPDLPDLSPEAGGPDPAAGIPPQ